MARSGGVRRGRRGKARQGAAGQDKVRQVWRGQAGQGAVRCGKERHTKYRQRGKNE